MIVIDNLNCLEKKHLDSDKTIVILAKYNSGKSSVCTNKIFGFFENVLYLAFVDQNKPNFKPRENNLNFGELVKDKIIIFDEINDDNGRDVEKYLKNLIKDNKVIILSNPYGSSDDPEKEVKLFKEHEDLNEASFIYLKK